jgi:hypothetical protein
VMDRKGGSGRLEHNTVMGLSKKGRKDRRRMEMAEDRV